MFNLYFRLPYIYTHNTATQETTTNPPIYEKMDSPFVPQIGACVKLPSGTYKVDDIRYRMNSNIVEIPLIPIEWKDDSL